jgi:hypothetical protein
VFARQALTQCGAGVSPAIFVRPIERKIAGGTPAPRNIQESNKTNILLSQGEYIHAG